MAVNGQSELPSVAILAGGLATRLRPFTDTIPKSLVPINGRPFIAHQLDLLRASGITKAVICAGFKGDQIIDYVGDGGKFGVEVRYSSEGERLLGTGGALRRALPLLGPDFFVVYGDSYLRCDYRGVYDAFRNSRRLALMTVFQNENQWDTSNVRFVNERIVAYDKTARTADMHHIDYGLGVLSNVVFDDVLGDTPVDLAVVYGKLLESNQLAGYQVPERFYEMGSWQGVEELSAFLRQREEI